MHVQGVHTLVPPHGDARGAAAPAPLPADLPHRWQLQRVPGEGAQHPVADPGAPAAPGGPADRRLRLRGPPVRRGARLGPGDDHGHPQRRLAARRSGRPVARVPGRIVSVGRVERYKGHHRAIEALPHLLARRIPRRTSRCSAAGPYEPDLLALAESLGVRDRVTRRVHPAGGPGADGGADGLGERDDAAQRLRGAPGGGHGGPHRGDPGRGQPDLGPHRARGHGLGRRRRPARDPGGDRGGDRPAARRPGAPRPVHLAHMGDVCCWCGGYL